MKVDEPWGAARNSSSMLAVQLTSGKGIVMKTCSPWCISFWLALHDSHRTKLGHRTHRLSGPTTERRIDLEWPLWHTVQSLPLW